MKPNDGGPAFPLTEDAVCHKNRDFAMQGMSLRDWFAGQAMANANYRMVNPAHQARLAYDLADAMLAERRRPAAWSFRRAGTATTKATASC